MEILVSGVNHRTAPVEVREQLAVPPDVIGPRLVELTRPGGPEEAVLVSTCNRVELYVAARDPEAAGRAMQAFLQQNAATQLRPHLYEHAGPAATRHLFRVASSLDSMVVGEPQILGQVKDAYTIANEAGTIGPILSKAFHRAFQVAKRVRTDTAVARSAVSMSAVAVELVSAIFQDLADKRVLLVGAGEMAELAARHLTSAGVAEILVINRSLERAQRVAEEVGGRAHGFEAMDSLLPLVDIVISSTASPTFVLAHDAMKRVVKVRKYRPLFLVDLAVPRDIDPRVGELANVYLYDVDDLARVADQHRQARSQEAEAAERIVEEESAAFGQWLRALEVLPTLLALREKLGEIGRAELERALAVQGPNADPAAMLKRLSEAIINKILHHPTICLKREAQSGGAELAATVQRLFDLELSRAASAPTEAAPQQPSERADDPKAAEGAR